MLIVCGKCLCNKCINNVDNIFLDKSKLACFNCDDCYYYDFKDSKDKNVKFKCDSFIIADCYAKANRNRINLVRR